MTKQNEIDLKFLNEVLNDKQNHIARLNTRIDELLRMREILLDDIEKITDDIENIEADIKEIENK